MVIKSAATQTTRRRESTVRLLRRHRRDAALTGAAGTRQAVQRAVTSAARRRGAPPPAEQDFDAAFNLALWRYAAQLQHGRAIDNPAGWLVTATINALTDQSRTADARHRAGTDPDALSRRAADDRELDDSLYLSDRAVHALRALTALRERSRQAIVLSRLEGLTYQQIGRRLDISAKAAEKAVLAATPVLESYAADAQTGELCGDVGSGVRAYARHLLTVGGPRHRQVSAHLRHCPACRAQVREIRGIQAVLPPLAVPATIRPSIAEQLGDLLDRAGHELAGLGAAAGAGGAGVTAVTTTGGGVAVTGGVFAGLAGKTLATCLAGVVCVGGGLAVTERAERPEPRSVAGSPIAPPATRGAGTAAAVTAAPQPASIIAAAPLIARKAVAADRAAAKRAARRRARLAAARQAQMVRATAAGARAAAREFGPEPAPAGVGRDGGSGGARDDRARGERSGARPATGAPGGEFGFEGGD